MTDESKADDGAKPNGVLPPDLQKRILSGLAVAAIALLAVYAGPVPFAVLTLLISAIMSWEWGRVVRSDGFDTIGWVHIICVAVAAVLAGLGMAGLGVAAVVIGAITVIALSFGGTSTQLSGLGVLYTGLPLVSLIWLRSDEPLGFLAVVFVLLVVVVTDTAAFVSGKTAGGPKLAPTISPGKTWSGLVGGVVSAAVAAALFSRVTGSGSIYWLAALGLMLGLVAQAGDLGESALKRRFGLKDASDLIPGHGGFMDRMDGVVTAAMAASLLALAIDAYAPARALLYGD
jgi:phosphatidate cytidylyltransferase